MRPKRGKIFHSFSRNCQIFVKDNLLILALRPRALMPEIQTKIFRLSQESFTPKCISFVKIYSCVHYVGLF